MNLSEQFTEKEIHLMKKYPRDRKISFWASLFAFLFFVTLTIYTFYMAYKYGGLPLNIPGQLLEKPSDLVTLYLRTVANMLFWLGMINSIFSLSFLIECIRAKKVNLQSKCYGMIVAMLEEQKKESCENTGDTAG